MRLNDYLVITLVFTVLCLAATLDRPAGGQTAACRELQREFTAADRKCTRLIRVEDWTGAQDTIGYMRGIDRAMRIGGCP